MLTHTHKPQENDCVWMAKITDLKVHFAPVQLSFSVNYHFTFQFSFRVGLKVCFLRWSAGETSLILDEQHHAAVQSQ